MANIGLNWNATGNRNNREIALEKRASKRGQRVFICPGCGGLQKNEENYKRHWKEAHAAKRR